MGGPIVRTGTTPKFWENWENVFGEKKKARKKTTSAKSNKKQAKKSTKKAAKRTAKK